jgi:hypothetical protein
MRLRHLLTLFALLTLLAPAHAFAFSNAGTNGKIVFTRDMGGGKHHIFVANPDGSGAVDLTPSSSADNISPSVSPDGTRVAFSSNRAGTYDLYVMNIDGTGTPLRITGSLGSEIDPVWTPDGDSIVYAATTPPNTDFDLFEANQDGSGAKTLYSTNGDDVQPALSPDGSWLLWTHRDPAPPHAGQIWKMRLSDSSALQAVLSATDDHGATWSPDSMRFAWDCGGSVCVVGADGASISHLPTPGGATGSVVWSPDGSLLAYASSTGLRTMQPDGSGGSTLTGSGSDDVGDWPAALVNLWVPVVRGSLTLGGTLSADAGLWAGSDPLTFTYQWLRCNPVNGDGCVAIPGATTSSYVPVVTDLNAALRVSVTATSPLGTATATSASVGPIEDVPPVAPANKTLPVISGAPIIGQTLSASYGTWTAALGTTYAYQWERCSGGGTNCVPITGVGGPTYTVVSDDAGSTLEVLVTAVNALGALSVSSLPTPIAGTGLVDGGPGLPAQAINPAVLGAPVIGGTLSATKGGFVGASLRYSFQWQRCDTSGASCSSIGGATSATYTPKQPDLGSSLRVLVTATNTTGSASASSDVTSPVQAAPATATSAMKKLRAVVLRGTAHADRLTVRRGTTSIVAGAGNDTIVSADGRREVVDCGPGRDTVRADRSDVLRHCEVVRYVKRAPARSR